MKEVVFGLLLLSLLIFGCAGAGGTGSGTGTVSSSDITDEDLSVGDLSIDLSEDDTALPEQVN
jgi:hypothetical protein